MFVKQAVILAAAASMVAANPVPAHTPPGKKRDFPYANGNKFGLNGLDFYFAGSNAYYLPFSNNYADNLAGLKAARKVGLKVMRTWAFNERNATFDDTNGMPKYFYDWTGTYFQEWKDGKATINYGPDGLQKLDAVVKAAEQADVKLVMTLTNNWADYGGMDMYTINLGYKYHDDFYSKPAIIAAYKNYVKAVVQRYKHSKAIFSWQLGNEPRCGADGNRNLPRSPNCNVAMLHGWVEDLSKFIKSLDPDHMVSVGGEGAFNRVSDDWAYNGADGVDFEAETAVEWVDYGTFHLYPDWWSKTPQWGTKWIKDHAAAGRALNKPVVFEEYGWLSPEKRLEYLGAVSNYTRLEVIKEWQETSIAEKLAGDQYWQFGWYGWSYGANHNDGFTIFLNDTEAGEIINKHARHVSALNH